MGALVSAEMKHAIKLVTGGKSPYEAAKLTGLDPSSIYKALKRNGKRHNKKKVAKATE